MFRALDASNGDGCIEEDELQAFLLPPSLMESVAESQSASREQDFSEVNGLYE
jgi:hypothetical protein